MEISPNRRRAGLPGWFAPILGVVLGIGIGVYTLIVNRQDFETANVDRQEMQPRLLLLSGIIGVLAGLIMWCWDVLRGQSKNQYDAQKQPLQYVSVQFGGRVVRGFRPTYEGCKIAADDAFSGKRACRDTMQRVGGRLISLCIGSLLLGRLIVAIFYPEFSEGELTWAKLAVLIPIWSVGLIGIVLWIAGTMRRSVNPRKPRTDL